MTQVHPVRSAVGFGMAVKSIRKQQGATQREFAERLGISHRWISELEAGKPKRLDNEFFIRLASMGVAITVTADE